MTASPRSGKAPGWERAVIVVAPLCAVVTMGLGLRIGAARAVHAAVVYGAPPGEDRAGLAWQIVTLLDDRGVRESVAMAGLAVTARAGGRQARWEGATNGDGVAEAWLDLPGVAAGDPVWLEVTGAGERTPLASGAASWPATSRRTARAGPAFVRPSKQDGALRLDVAIYAGRLVPGFPSSVWVRVRDSASGAPVAGACVEATPEPGLALAGDRATTDRDGWALLRASAEVHVVALGLRAETAEEGPRREGAWYGALPVAPGAAFVDVPAAIPEREPTTFDVVVPTVTPRVYVEVDDAEGRVSAAALDLVPSPRGPHAVFAARGLSPGTYWLVTAGDPRGAEGLAGAALARPFHVDPPSVTARAGPALATLEPPDTARFVALDGLPGKRRGDGGRHRAGLALAFGALVAAAAVEALLILRGTARARAQIAEVALLLDPRAPRLERRFGAASVVLGLLLALLGFALLAALLTWRAT